MCVDTCVSYVSNPALPGIHILLYRWFQEPAVKKNACLVIGAWILVFLGIGNHSNCLPCSNNSSCLTPYVSIELHSDSAASLITGIGLEISHHENSQAITRGIVFFIVAFVVLLPSCEYNG